MIRLPAVIAAMANNDEELEELKLEHYEHQLAHPIATALADASLFLADKFDNIANRVADGNQMILGVAARKANK